MSDTTNRWKISDSVKEKYTPLVVSFIDELEKLEADISTPILKKDFSDTELNPSTLGLILESLGYKNVSHDDNGWELDFWITYEKQGYKPIMITGCGMTFELELSEVE